MEEGKLVMNPAEAKAKAEEMKKIAFKIETLLNGVKRKMQEIDNVDTGIYQGNRRPAQLRAELDNFASTFHCTFEQVIKSADDIIAIATVSENQ